MHVNPLDAGHFASYQWLSTNPKHQYYTSSTLIHGARFAVKCKLVIPEVDNVHVLPYIRQHCQLTFVIFLSKWNTEISSFLPFLLSFFSKEIYPLLNKKKTNKKKTFWLTFELFHCFFHLKISSCPWTFYLALFMPSAFNEFIQPHILALCLNPWLPSLPE